MSFQRIRISSEATNRLQALQGRTGLTPNILARFAINFSLTEPKIPNHTDYDIHGQEFNRYTLTGEWDPLFMALMKERCVTDGLDPDKHLREQFLAHVNRGILSLAPRIRSLSDLFQLVLTNMTAPQKKKYRKD